MICCVKLTDRLPSAELYQTAGMDICVQDAIIRNHLSWYGHIIH